MKKMINKRLKYILIIILLFLIINVAISLAYLSGTISNTESVSTVALKAGSLNIIYSSDSSDIVASNISPGFETTKQFTITSDFGENHSYYNYGVWYKIALIIEQNEFDNDSISYSLALDNTSGNDGITAVNVLDTGLSNGQNISGLQIGTGAFFNNNISHVYNLKISYKEKDIDQSHEIGYVFKAHIAIQEPELISITFDLDGGSFENLKLNSNSSMEVAAKSVINLPIPTKDGYAFAGWEIINGNFEVDNTLIRTHETDISLKALWANGIFDYAVGEHQFIAELDGYYKIEAWGAQGGGSNGGKGGYSSGIARISKGDVLKVYVGGAGNSSGVGGYNGGGNAGVLAVNNDGGGGATDIRIINNTINDRILVAGGGGGANANGSNTGGIGTTGGAGGGLNGYSGTSVIANMFGCGATQISGGARGYTSRNPGTSGSFYYGGVGGISDGTPTVSGGAGGGGGYYGGGSGEGCNNNCGGSGGGGSSYISGHTGCVAIESSTSTTIRTGTEGASCTTGTTDNLCSVHYSGKVFTDTVMIDGAGYVWTNIKGALQPMPNPNGGYYASGVGHAGNGYARITYLHR